MQLLLTKNFIVDIQAIPLNYLCVQNIIIYRQYIYTILIVFLLNPQSTINIRGAVRKYKKRL